MPFVDPRTFLIVANLLGLLCALVLWVQARSFPPDIEGLADWAKAVVLIGSASGLASLRGEVHDGLSIVAANGLLLFGQWLLIVGLMRYHGRRPHWRPTLDVLAAVLLLVAWLTFGARHYPGRIFVMALAESGFFTYGAWLAWRAQPRGFGSRFLTAAFLVGAAVAVWRIVTLSAGNGGSDEAFDRDFVQQVYLAMFSLGVLVLSIGFILLANERLRVELEFMATRDPMTGVLNRRAFFARAAIEWARAARSQRPLAVIVSDIDFFKKINDTHGHHVGDLVIKDFARRAQGMLRLPDILARFGGEEFVMLLPDTDLANARQVAERIRRELEIPRAAALPAYTASLGVAATRWQNGDAADIEALIAQADAALYRAKQGGRNRVEA